MAFINFPSPEITVSFYDLTECLVGNSLQLAGVWERSSAKNPISPDGCSKIRYMSAVAKEYDPNALMKRPSRR